MARNGSLLFYILTCIFIFSMSLLCIAADEDRKDYIVYMGSLPKETYSPSSHHLSLLQEVIKGSSVGNCFIRSYKRSFNGFVAKLTSEEAQKLASKKEVVSVFPNTKLLLQTTRSWDFVGLGKNASRKASAESNVIVGVIDSGIWPESESFNDKGFGPPPKKWKGNCQGGQNFTCNNKIIGAKSYITDSVRDDVGHGTHTASTAAGNIVEDVSFFGLAQGTAKGGVPSARIAAYKVCATNECNSDGIMAAFDDAIADGVDIITISIGSTSASDMFNDPIAIGAFHAMEKGILTLQSAGNSGDSAGSVSSIAPWQLSVAASSTDRRIIDKVVLGNGKTLVGNSVNSFSLNGTDYPLIFGKKASTKCDELSAKSCSVGCLDPTLVKGKIVLCNSFQGINEAYTQGAVGAIAVSNVDDVSFIVPFPALGLTSKDFDVVVSYVDSDNKPVANILKSEAVKDAAAPVVVSFSSRGPNPIVPDILKPDVSAPGVDILAAYVPDIPPTDGDKRHVNYILMSGTSMSCPHAAGIAAYIKTFHSDWSPSAIKSAIMTTAWSMNASKNKDAEFAYGSGHVNPGKAINPGLVYETSKDDYIKFLCSIYDAASVREITKDNSSCSNGAGKVVPKDLNYPSLTAKVSSSESFTIEFQRTVTNVGPATSTYKAEIISNSKLQIKVEPQVLSFKSVNEKKSFNVTVTGGDLQNENIESASLVWSDGSHTVRSPIVLYA